MNDKVIFSAYGVLVNRVEEGKVLQIEALEGASVRISLKIEVETPDGARYEVNLPDAATLQDTEHVSLA